MFRQTYFTVVLKAALVRATCLIYITQAMKKNHIQRSRVKEKRVTTFFL